MPKARKITPRTPTSLPAPPVLAIAADRLLGDVRALIEAAREQTARAVNSALVSLYWHIGTRIRQDILRENRAGYGEEIVATLSRLLTAEFGRGYTEKGLRRMIQFAESFPDGEIVAALSRELSWSHFVELIPLEDRLKRDFYAEMCRVERWSVRTLRHKVAHLLYERTALSKKPHEVIARDIAALRDEDRITPDLVFRDPYFLDFLGLTAGTYSEKDVKAAILRELEAFILELGTDFAFCRAAETDLRRQRGLLPRPALLPPPPSPACRGGTQDREAPSGRQGADGTVLPRQQRRSHTNPKRERGSDEIK